MITTEYCGAARSQRQLDLISGLSAYTLWGISPCGFRALSHARAPLPMCGCCGSRGDRCTLALLPCAHTCVRACLARPCDLGCESVMDGEAVSLFHVGFFSQLEPAKAFSNRSSSFWMRSASQ